MNLFHNNAPWIRRIHRTMCDRQCYYDEEEGTESERAMKVVRDIGDLDSCILCGCMMHCDVERRYKQVQYIAWLVKNTCEPTPFVFQNIMIRAKDERESHISRPFDPPCQCSLSSSSSSATATMTFRRADKICTKGERAPFCIACINWVRRLSKSAKPPTEGVGVEEEGGAAVMGVVDIDGVESARRDAVVQGVVVGVFPPPAERDRDDDGYEEDDEEDTAETKDGNEGGIPKLSGMMMSKNRKSSSSSRGVKKKLGVIPMDNLLLFMHDPGIRLCENA